MNYRDRKNYCVYKLYDGSWCVFRFGRGDTYLFRDGRMRDWYKGLKLYGTNGANALTKFVSERSAEAALKKYLRRD